MDLREEVPLTKIAVLARIAEAEKYYQTLEKLDFRRSNLETDKVKMRKDNTAESFVRKFFNKFNTEFKTYYSKSGKLYTDLDTRRSIGDLYRTAQSYLGDNKITLLDIIKYTYQKVLKKEICSNYCYRINKRVYKERGPNKNGLFYDPNYIDELGLKEAHYKLLID